MIIRQIALPQKVPVHAPGVRNGETGKPWRGKLPPLGKHWQYPPRVLDEMDARGEIYWSPTGNPRRKIYLDQSEGVPVQDIWLDFRDAHNQNIEVSGYPTEKHPALLQRIIEASSNPGDLVLDCFSGSGTTLRVAAQTGRRWIGVDHSREAIATTLRRFRQGLEPMGDFVGKPESPEPDDEAEGTLSLFGPEETARPAPQEKVRHHAITDFVLLAQEPHHAELGDMLEQWREWTGAGQALQLAEAVMPYKAPKPGKQAGRKEHKQRKQLNH